LVSEVVLPQLGLEVAATPAIEPADAEWRP
jgi:hypothetical protein